METACFFLGKFRGFPRVTSAAFLWLLRRTRPQRRRWSRQSLLDSVCPHRPPAAGPKLRFCDPVRVLAAVPRAACPAAVAHRAAQGRAAELGSHRDGAVPAAWPWAHSRALPLSHGGYTRGPYQRGSGHVLPLHTRRESCAARSHHGTEGMGPCRDDMYCPCGPHSFLSTSHSGSPAKHGLSAGCTESCWQVSGLSFSSNRHDSVTLVWLGGLSSSTTIFHSSLQSP